MSDKKEEWQKLTISNNFIFSKVMRNKEICKEVLQRLLPNITISDIEIVEYEKVFDATLESKSVRMDIYADDGKIIYNVEMQAVDDDDLAKRSRVYQAHIDMDGLDKGKKYLELKDSFVIFICKFDLFDKGLPVYTFNYNCKEDQTLYLENGATTIFFNTTNYNLAKNDKMSEFLRFIHSKSNEDFKTNDEFIQKLMVNVENVKQNTEYEVEFMRTSMMLDKAEYKGKIEMAVEMAIEMLKDNKPIEEIIKYSKLSMSKIEELQKELGLI